MHWDDLRFVLSVSREQSLAGAAKALGVNQTTVARRLQSIEKALGTRLFDRIDQRWIPTAAGSIAVRHAERMDAESIEITKEIIGRDQRAAGKVRLTSVPGVTNGILAPQIADLLNKYPDIELELIDSQENLNLAHLEADLAIRLSRPTLSSAVTRRIGTLNFNVYVSEKYAERANELPWVGFSESRLSLQAAQWVEKQIGNGRPVVRVSDSNVSMNIVRNLPCRAVLPETRVMENSGLVNLSGSSPVVSRELWLVYMKAMRKNVRVAAVAAWAADVCSQFPNN